MILSKLQKYILKKCLERRAGKMTKKELLLFYKNQSVVSKADDQTDGITKSVDRLIAKGLITGRGVKTAKKWFVEQVALTQAGKKTARSLFGKQQQLHFKDKK